MVTPYRKCSRYKTLLFPLLTRLFSAPAYHDTFVDHLQTYQTKSAVSQVHDWVVYKMGTLLGSVGHRFKIHKITPATGKQRVDIEIKDYMVLQKPQTQGNRLAPPRDTS